MSRILTRASKMPIPILRMDNGILIRTMYVPPFDVWYLVKSRASSSALSVILSSTLAKSLLMLKLLDYIGKSPKLPA